MSKQDIEVAARRFFDDFNVVFATFSGSRIAERYVAPYLAIRSDGSSAVFRTAESIATYFQHILDGYQARGCRICKYKDLAIVPIGSAAAFATVTWELCQVNGRLVTSWRESYNLVFLGGNMKAAVSVDHAV